MLNLQVLTGLLAAMQQQQKFQLPNQQQQPQPQQQQQQQPSPQQMAFNPFMPPMIPGLPFPIFPQQMSATAMAMASMNESNGRKMTPKVNKETAAPLQQWFDDHLGNPYPTEEDMRNLKMITGFTDTQLGDWFRNKRRNYKKNHGGNIPWQIPSTTIRKRRASSVSNQLNDSSSPDSTATAQSASPPPLRMPSTPTTSATGMASPSAYNFLLAALATPTTSSNPIQSPPNAESNVKQEPSDSSPPEKKIKLSIEELLQNV